MIFRRAFTSSARALKVFADADAATVASESSGKTVLVDFFATWCQPCKILSPALHSVANKADIDLIEVDVDKHPDVARQFNVRAMPTVVAVKDGKPVDSFVGVIPPHKITEFVEKIRQAK